MKYAVIVLAVGNIKGVATRTESVVTGLHALSVKTERVMRVLITGANGGIAQSMMKY